MQYDDPTNSVQRGPFQKQADGSWKKLMDPKDVGGDDNVHYEDKWSLMWNINDSVAGFNQNGCAAMCHAGEEASRMATSTPAKDGEFADMWHMKGSRNGAVRPRR